MESVNGAARSERSDPAPAASVEPGLVSVIVPAYNRAATIADTLGSITAQEGWPFEVIVVDDGSSDGTAGIARRHSPPVQVIEQPNQRRSAARNNGARHARGEFLYFFDSDDLMEPRAIARLAACLRDHPEAALAYGSALVFVDDPAAAVPRLPACTRSGHLLAVQLAEPFLIPIMCLVRRAWFDRAGGMSTRLDGTEDFHFFLKLAALGGRFECIGGGPVARYREYAVQRAPGSIHSLGNVRALELIAEEFGGRIPAEMRLPYHVARFRASYSRHLLREGRRWAAWREWLSTLPHCRDFLASYAAVFVTSLVMPAATAERLLSGGAAALRRLLGIRRPPPPSPAGGSAPARAP
jgi:glycosyltransferase involved in cell wall biosynthesis